MLRKILGKLAVDVIEYVGGLAVKVIQDSIPKNAADDQREQDRLNELRNVAKLGGEDGHN